MMTYSLHLVPLTQSIIALHTHHTITHQLPHQTSMYTTSKTTQADKLTDTRLATSFPRQQHRKGKTILDFTEARDDEVAVASAGPYANHLHLTPDR